MAKDKITQIDIDLMPTGGQLSSPRLTYRVVIHRPGGRVPVKVASITPKSAVRLHQWLLKHNYEMGIPQATDMWFFIPYRLSAKEIK